jgi:predicted nucleotidyltransferase
MDQPAVRHPLLDRMLRELERAAGEKLRSVVLYGSAARGDFHEKTSDLNLMIVLGDLEPETLELVSGPVAWWERNRQPVPRLFSPALIADAADVFPIEFLDIRQFHVVLAGADPLAGVEIRPDHLRHQCERELREKMMRLREGYVECHARPRDLERLLTDSYTTFVALFRGGLHLLGGGAPVHNHEVVAAFCRSAGLDPAPFDEVDRLKRGERAGEPKRLFSRYYAELTKAVSAVDRFGRAVGGDSR